MKSSVSVLTCRGRAGFGRVQGDNVRPWELGGELGLLLETKGLPFGFGLQEDSPLANWRGPSGGLYCRSPSMGQCHTMNEVNHSSNSFKADIAVGLFVSLLSANVYNGLNGSLIVMN